MALQLNITAQGGISVADAYVRISEVTGFKNYTDGKYYMSIGLKVYKDSVVAATASPVSVPAGEFDREICELDLNSSDNALVQAYAYIKTLNKFTGAVDV